MASAVLLESQPFDRMSAWMQKCAPAVFLGMRHLLSCARYYSNIGRGFEFIRKEESPPNIEAVGDGWIKPRRTTPLDGKELETYSEAQAICMQTGDFARAYDAFASRQMQMFLVN